MSQQAKILFQRKKQAFDMPLSQFLMLWINSVAVPNRHMEGLLLVIFKDRK